MPNEPITDLPPAEAIKHTVKAGKNPNNPDNPSLVAQENQGNPAMPKGYPPTKPPVPPSPDPSKRVSVPTPQTVPQSRTTSSPLPHQTDLEEFNNDASCPEAKIDQIVQKIARCSADKVFRGVLRGSSLFNLRHWTPDFRAAALSTLTDLLHDPDEIADVVYLLLAQTNDHYTDSRAARAVLLYLTYHALGLTAGLVSAAGAESPDESDSLDEFETEEPTEEPTE